MDYEEIITAYKNGGLDISNLQDKLKMARPLKGRPQYTISDKSPYYFDIVYLMGVAEKPERVKGFESSLDVVLNEYYKSVIDSIRKLKAWKYMDLVPSEYTIEKFQELPRQERFKKIYEINKKYSEYLENKKIADIRDTFKPNGELNEEEEKQLMFLQEMYNGFNSHNTKTLFHTFRESFLLALVNFKKSKTLRLEEYMQEKENSKKARDREVFREYKNCSEFFTIEDYRDIVENLLSTSKTLNKSVNKIIEYYSVMSEGNSEQEVLEDFNEHFKEIEKKYLRINSIKIEEEKARRQKNSIEEKQKRIEEARKHAEELRKRKLEIEKKERAEKERLERERIIKQEEGSTGVMQRKVDNLRKTELARELVKPLIFFWFGKEDVGLEQKIGTRKINEFFRVLKDYEKRTGERISLFMITNADKNITKKRLNELQDKAKEKDLPRIIEGALGGYSSFKIDASGNIIDLAQMSFENREKIIKLLDRKLRLGLPPDIIDEKEENYLRYEISKKPDKNIDAKYINVIAYRLQTDKDISKQPLKFISYMEDGKSGIDVILNSQYKGLSQLADYYEAKYHRVAPGKSLQVNINSIDDFLRKSLDIETR